MKFEDDAGGIDSGHPTFIHVFDLPQLYQKPSVQSLLYALESLAVEPVSFTTCAEDTESPPIRGVQHDQRTNAPRVLPDGVPRYLTSIISSSLNWLDEDQKVRIWELASSRLAERSGRTATGGLTRSFDITPGLTIKLHEPSLTEDQLGLKTWTSSLLLARRLRRLPVPDRLFGGSDPNYIPRILELGSGTGLVGLAAAATWTNAHVTLTDLPEIVPNLRHNIENNSHLLSSNSVSSRDGVRSRIVSAHPLDWSEAEHTPSDASQRYSLILCADPIYSSDHPAWLVSAVHRWLDYSSPNASARFVLELPLRPHFGPERKELKKLLTDIAGLEIDSEGEETGYDDWFDNQGRQVEVRCWWSVWKPTPVT